MKNPNRYPPGWDEERVRRVLEHYESQTDEEAIAEDEAALRTRPKHSLRFPMNWFQPSERFSRKPLPPPSPVLPTPPLLR